MIVFLSSSLANPQKRKLLLSSPFGVVELWINLFDRSISASDARVGKRSFKPDFELFKRSAVNTLLISFLYVFMEWIFYVTKPSFMDLLSWGDKTKIFLVTGLVIALLSVLVLIVIALLDLLLSPFFPSFREYAFRFPAAFLLTCLSLILLDNFTYTNFEFWYCRHKDPVAGPVWTRVYWVADLFYETVGDRKRKTRKPALEHNEPPQRHRFNNYPLTLVGLTFKNNNALAQVEQNSGDANKPNIILFGTDGLNAANMSVYGYNRDTTPFITGLAQSSLLSQNNFSNAASSEGSDTATLTGKLPLTTPRFVISPDILQGINEYQHLPGILKSAGYRTVFLGEPNHDDVNAANFQNAFDAVNCEDNSVDSFSGLVSGYGFDEEVYFLSTLKGRIVDRFDHIFFIKDMVNPFTSYPVKGSKHQ